MLLRVKILTHTAIIEVLFCKIIYKYNNCTRFTRTGGVDSRIGLARVSSVFDVENSLII